MKLSFTLVHPKGKNQTYTKLQKKIQNKEYM